MLLVSNKLSKFFRWVRFIRSRSCKLTPRGRGWNKPNILRAFLASGVKKKLRALIFSFIIFYLSGINMNQHFRRPFGPMVWTFCRPSPNFDGNWPECLAALLILTLSRGHRVQDMISKYFMIFLYITTFEPDNIHKHLTTLLQTVKSFFSHLFYIFFITVSGSPLTSMVNLGKDLCK